ncbi:MAG: mercury methylation corrinoid protein HgcA [Acidobacteriota bacterium]|nr:mercury methylation corrinoid protein HgcA [Acidobacteriota bacterium]
MAGKKEIGASRDTCDCGPECCGWSSKKEEEEIFLEESDRWIEGRTAAPAGPVPVVRTKLGRTDVLGTIKARLGLGRMNYKIKPGLYAVGGAHPDSPVLVSANYKLSFDALRRELSGLDAWILVLDTKGINVWCAAGKGTFGTDELVYRIEDSGLDRVVSHRTLILPQLGAPGVAAHDVARRTRFKVVYGPVRAADIKGFLAAGMKATPEMRRVVFTFKDRLVLTAVELINPFKYLLPATAVLGVLYLFGLPLPFREIWLPFLGAVLVGAFLVPILLPWIPVRAFALKGWLAGVAWAAAVCWFRGLIPPDGASWEWAAAYLLLLPAVSTFLAMGFTGSSTFTSLSGVLKEMRVAVPAVLVSASLGIVVLVVALIRGF